MRWIVDVSSLEGKEPAQNYCVEAESWQGALQSARRLRGDESRMAGFSIDITNDGCKAVDPSKKLRYEVKRTTDATPLTPGAEAPAPSKRRISGAPPRPDAGAAAAPAKPAKPEPPKPAPKPDATVKMNASSVAEVEPPPSAPSVAKAAPPAPATTPMLAPTPTPAAMIAIPPILVQREQEPTAEVPLTYREYGFAFASGTSEEAAATALLQQLSRIQSVIAGSPAGKLVNLAAFDQIFTGRPTILPLATLTWKDWKPEPAITYPRRAKPKPAPAPVAAPAPAPVAAPAPAPVATPAPAPLEIAVVAAPEFAPPVSQTREKPPVPKGRVRGDELISVLFEAMHDLNFLPDSIQGADFCLHLALEKLPSRIGIVYLYDIDRREFVIVSVLGTAPPGIVGKRFPENAPVLSSAMRKRRAMLLTPNDIASHATTIGGAQHVLLAPVMQAGRFLGAIELADPSDAHPYNELDANAITYMAEQYAEFVAARGILLDRERTSQPPAAQQH